MVVQKHYTKIHELIRNHTPGQRPYSTTQPLSISYKASMNSITVAALGQIASLMAEL